VRSVALALGAGCDKPAGFARLSGAGALMNLQTILEEQILHRVERPSRYVGSEVNSTRKDPSQAEIRLALCFPDLYDLGLGNLGLHILYTCVNKLDFAMCERVYAPGKDMEHELRSRGLNLFALESKDTLDVFDGIGFTLQTELSWTNILNIINMSGIPLRTADRGEEHGLTFAGGPAVFNPEPLAPFMDFFVIGDGEDAIVEIAHTLRATKALPRAEKLLALSKLEGVYVPALYPFDTLENGAIVPALDAPKIRKRLTRDLNGATFPTDYIVPFTPQVHDRVSLEVLRGCTQGCRFCQAGMVTRPVRERKLERVDELLRRTLASTGYEEVSLVSLSTCDYSRVRQLVENTAETVRDMNVAISLPSLRLDSFSVDLADMVADVRRTGLTFAPEAASPRLRALINKWIPDEELLNMSAKAFQLQWSHVKLYFMIGLPTERDDDIEAIADLARRTVIAGKQFNRRAAVNLGVSTFVPKPFTPFQWAEQIEPEEINRRQRVLGQALNHRDIKFGRHQPEETFLEGLVSRSDRRAGDLIEAAWRKGCRFDAWSEHLRFDWWMEAVAETGFDVKDAMRERSVDERLPWDHIDVLIPKSWFAEDWQRALELKHAEDCRHKKCHKCGVIDAERPLCAAMLRDNIEARKTEAAFERKPRVEPVPKPPVQRILFRVARTGPARFLSHLEAMNAWVRSLRRARAPLAFSEGFHPHPKVAFSSALPVGQESLGEYMDVELSAFVDATWLAAALKATAPDGFDVLDTTEVDSRYPSLMSLNAGGIWRILFGGDTTEDIEAAVAEVLGAEQIAVERSTKAARQKRGRGRGGGAPGTQPVDMRAMIRELRVEPGPVPCVHATLVAVDGKPPKLAELVNLLTENTEKVRAVKVDSLRVDGEGWSSMSLGWTPPPRRAVPSDPLAFPEPADEAVAVD